MIRIVCLLLVWCISNNAWAQLPVEMAIQPLLTYTESFDDISNWADGFTYGVGAERFGAIAAQGAGTIPNGTRTTHSTTAFANTSSGGVHRDGANQRIRLLATGATDNTSAAAIDLFMDFTGVDAGTLSFHWNEVNNGQSTSNRKGSLQVYGSVDGVNFTGLTGAAVLDVTNFISAGGDVVNVPMPSFFNGSSSARLRFYYYNGTGGTSGSRPYIALDDIKVTATGSPCLTPSSQLSTLSLTSLSDTSIQGSFASTAADEYLVLASNSSSLSALPEDSTLYNTGDVLGNAVVAYRGPANSFTALGLAASTTYNFFIFSANLYCSGAVKYNTVNPLTGTATTQQSNNCLAPIAQPTNLQFSNVSHSTISGNFIAAQDASDYLVILSTSNTLSALPQNGTIYQLGSTIGGGTVVSWSNSTSFSATGLLPTTTYYFYVFGANHSNCNDGPTYNTSSLTATQATDPMPNCIAPSGSAKDLILQSSNGNITGFFTPYNLITEGYFVVMSTSTTLNTLPADGTAYAIGDALGGGTIVSKGANYSFTASNLNDGTTYHFFVFSYNANCIGGPAYRTTDFLSGSYIASTALPSGYYFGNLHAHSSYSDGNKDDEDLTPANDFDFAKNSMCMDFLGISEHNHFSSTNNPGMLQPRYADGMNEAATFSSANPSFLALYGMEWGVINNGGHVLVYGAPGLWGWENVNSAPNYDVFVAKYNYIAHYGLFQTINEHQQYNVFGSLAHPSSTDYENLLSIPYNGSADSAISAVAVESGPAFSTETSYDDPAGSMDYLSYYRNMLAKGYHLAPIIDHDNHNLTFGRTAETRTVVISPSLDKDDFLSSVKNMHCYATQDCDTRVELDIYGIGMGNIMEHDYAPAIHVSVSDPTGLPTDTPIIKLMYGVSPSSALSAAIVTDTGYTLNYTHHSLTYNAPVYYYADIMVGNKRTITSPIWYTRTDSPPASVYETVRDAENTFSIATNPVGSSLTLKTSQPNIGKIEYCIYALNGVALKKGTLQFTGVSTSQSINTSDLQPGFYLIKIYNKGVNQTLKFIR